MKTLIGCMVTGYILLQFGHAMDRLSTDALGMILGLAFGALAMLGVPVLIVAAPANHPESPARRQPPVTLPRYEIIEDRAGRLYSYDSQTGTMELITAVKRIEVSK